MHNHEPQNYNCPFCRIAKGVEEDSLHTKQADVFYKDNHVTAFIASHWWPNNKGHIIIIPNEHTENIYDLSNALSDKIHRLEKKIAIAMKELYNCDGVSTRQHNEPSGDQEVWHYHLHIFPRYKDDNLYTLYNKKFLSTEKDRLRFSFILREYFN